MNTVLVRFESNYADEFDVSGFAVVEEGAWNKHLEASKDFFKVEGEHEIGFGTNENIQFSNFDEYRDSFQATTLAPNETEVLLKSFELQVQTEFNNIEGYGIFLTVPLD